MDLHTETTQPTNAVAWELRAFAVYGAVLCGLSVALGAFGTHSLDGLVTPDRLETFEVGARYQMYHGLALILVGLLALRGNSSGLFRWSARLLLVGTGIFSGSLYLLVALDAPWLGAVTPLGGLALILGWILFSIGLYRR